MNDVQITISENALKVAFESARKRLNSILMHKGEMKIGRITIGYENGIELSGGSLALNGDLVVIRELDIRWGKSALWISFDLPSLSAEFSIPPIVIPTPPYPHPDHPWCITILGAVSSVPRSLKFKAELFQEGNDPVLRKPEWSPGVSSEISASGKLVIDDSLTCRLQLNSIDFDLFDVEAAFGQFNSLVETIFSPQLTLVDVLNKAVQDAINGVTFDPDYKTDVIRNCARWSLSAWADLPEKVKPLKNSLTIALVGEDRILSVSNLLAHLLDINDDFGEWLAGVFRGPIGLKNWILTKVADLIVKEFTFQLQDPYVLLPADPERQVGAVSIDLKNVKMSYESDAVVLGVDFAP
jgi:hypothetical protein